MRRATLICLSLGLLAAPLAAGAQDPAPPAGPYQASCRDIKVKRDQILTSLTATCEPSRKATSIPLPCVGEVINRGGELVCRPRGSAAQPSPTSTPKSKQK